MPLVTSGLIVGTANKMEPLSVLTNGSAEPSFESKEQNLNCLLQSFYLQEL
jgi:hypothetical protein